MAGRPCGKNSALLRDRKTIHGKTANLYRICRTKEVDFPHDESPRWQVERLQGVPTMARFGILCSWLGTGIAIVLIGAAIFLPIAATGNRKDYILDKLMLFVAPAIVALVVGWGIRYLLPGLRK